MVIFGRKDDVRDTRWQTALDRVWQDARYAIRALHRSPGLMRWSCEQRLSPALRPALLPPSVCSP